jgi:hypothetical protein
LPTRCNIVEKDHLLILGWTDACYLLLREVALALEDTEAVVVVLCNHETEHRKEMMKRIKDVLPLRNLDVIVRNGFPGNITDLMTVAVCHARTIIVPAPQGDATEADNTVLNITMALKATQLAPGAHIVAELRDVDDEDMVGLLGGGDVVTVVSHDMVGRLMTMAARQPGLADVFAMLLGFDGDEFYLAAWPEIIGLSFGELPELFPDAIVCGYLDGRKQVHLNPKLDYKFCADDELLVIAESFDSYFPKTPNLKAANRRGSTSGSRKLSHFVSRKGLLAVNSLYTECEEGPQQLELDRGPGVSSPPHAQPVAKLDRRKVTPHIIDADLYRKFCTQILLGKTARKAITKEKFLIIGMRRDLRDILRSMNEVSFKGTQCHLLNELSEEEQIESLEEAGDFTLMSLTNLEIVHHTGNPVSRFHLQRFNVVTKFIEFSTIFITAGEKNELNTTNSDSKNIATLLLVRNIQSETQMEEAAMGFKKGDRVRIIKDDPRNGEQAIINDPNSAGLVQIVMDSNGESRSYLALELEHADAKSPHKTAFTAKQNLCITE